jgi:membrane associated rhomboid family serine protease
MLNAIKNDSLLFLALLINALVSLAVSMDSSWVNVLALSHDSFSHPYQLLTFNFVHTGYFHFFSNMVVTYVLGRLLKRWYSHTQMAIVYFVSPMLVGVVGCFIYQLYPEMAIGYSGVTFVMATLLAYHVTALRNSIIIQVIGFHLILYVASIPVSYIVHSAGVAVGLGLCCLLKHYDKAESPNFPIPS